MSATEKLKALYETYSWPNEKVLRNALPQIVAVVEAAQRAESYLEKSAYLVGAEGVLEELTPALAALDEALS